MTAVDITVLSIKAIILLTYMVIAVYWLSVAVRMNRR